MVVPVGLADKNSRDEVKVRRPAGGDNYDPDEGWPGFGSPFSKACARQSQ